jgi:DNA repair exonuclease SbcCD ATPase subunit
MRIKLTNFKCHRDAEFVIPDDGMILLSGRGGAGKTSILFGITYALYGKIPSKARKPYTHGKKTCVVELEYMDMTITRSSRSIVKVEEDGVLYEGDEAEDIIKTRIGMTYDEFLIGVFIVQRSSTSVLSMTSTEQLHFIETLAKTETASEVKEKIKEKIKDIKNEMLKTQGEMSTLTDQRDELLNKYSEGITIPEEIENGIDPDTVRSDIEDFKTQMSDLRVEMNKLNTKISKIKLSEKKKQDTQKSIDNLNAETKQLNTIIESTQELSDEDLESLENDVAEMRSNISYYTGYLDFIKQKDMLDKAIGDYKNITSSRIKEIKAILLSAEEIDALKTNYEEAVETKQNYMVKLAKYNTDLAAKEDAKSNLAKIFRKIKALYPTKKSKDISKPKDMILFLKKCIASTQPRMQCPHCDATLVVVESELMIPPDEVDYGTDDIEISTVKKMLYDVEDFAKKFNVTPCHPGDQPPDPSIAYKKYFSEVNLREEYQKLQTQKLPPSLLTAKTNITKTAKIYEEEGVIGPDDVQETIDSLTQELDPKISDYESAKNIKSINSKHRLELKEKISKMTNLKKILDELNKTTPSLKNLEIKLNSNSKKVMEINDKIVELTNILNNVAEYEDYLSVIESADLLDEKIIEATTRYDALENKLKACYGLEEAAKEAEIVVLEETARNINEHAKIYLDKMFEDPIAIELRCIKDKKGKGTKLQLNTSIDYQGDTYDTVEELSGSERQRCDIAFLMAVNDIVGGKLLMMDESINCMDSALNTDVLNIIHNVCVGKLVLMISHEAVRGIFDDEIPVSH